MSGAVIVDLVGTVVSSGEEVPQAFREAFGRFGLPVSDPEVDEVRGRAKREAIARILDGMREPEGEARPSAGEVYDTFVEILRARMVAGATPVPGVAEALARIRAVVVGDTEVDLAAAEAAGAGCVIGVLSGAHGEARLRSRPHTAILGSVAELPSWLAERDWPREETGAEAGP